MRMFAWILVIIGSLIGGAQFFVSFSATSAPQQTAGIAMALGWVILPYCFARACEGLSSAPEKLLQEISSKMRSEATTRDAEEPETVGGE
jgi:hypothetical protein